jgi:hypothetical protein
VKENLMSALIAAAVSLVVALASLLATSLQLRNARKRQQIDIAHTFSERIYDQRIKLYPAGYALLGRIRRLGPPHYLPHPDHMKEVKDNINQWAGETSLFFSRDTAEAYWDLRSALAKNPAHGDDYSEQQAEKVYLARNRLRQKMRVDVGNLYSGDINESAEHWEYL